MTLEEKQQMVTANIQAMSAEDFIALIKEHITNTVLVMPEDALDQIILKIQQATVIE